MIQGIGVDSVQVQRIAHSLQNERFLNRVYSAEERALIASRGEKRAAEAAAGCFAAKEAFLKALGVGLGGFPLAEIAALRKPSGQPYYALAGKAAAHCAAHRLTAHLTLTHEAGVATAFAVLEAAE